MTFNKLFLWCLFFIAPLFSWSQQEMKAVKGIMEKKSSDNFFISGHEENCSIPIHRGVLKKTQKGRTMDSFIESNWEANQILSVAVPSDAVEDAECRDLDFVDNVDQGAQVDVAGGGPGYDSRPPSYECGSPEYLALEERVKEYNSRSRGDSSRGVMELPSCIGGRSIPLDCGSEEYQEALRSGNPVGPCKGSSGSSVPYCGSEEHRELEREARGDGENRRTGYVRCKERTEDDEDSPTSRGVR